MQRTKKRPDSMPGFQIGTSYLLVIFIILCLVTFAALALSSALRDQSYSQALAKHQTEYAAASTQASALLAQIDEALESETPEPALEARRITAWRETAVSGWEEQTTLPVLGSDRTEND